MDSQQRNAWMIFVASFFVTCASMMITSTLTLYHEHVLHLSKLKLGSIQSWATIAMYGTKFFTGVIVDIFKNYKAVLIMGSVLTMATRFLFAFVTSPLHIFFLRSAERLTKGLRAVPTDAYLTINSSKEAIGSSIAKKQVFYTGGGITGVIIAATFLYFYPLGYTNLYMLAVIPGMMATAAFMMLKPIPFTEKKSESNVRWSQIKDFPKALYFAYFLGYMLTVARIGENFLGHRFYELYPIIALIPLVYIVLDIPWMMASWWLVKRMDRSDIKMLSLWGVGVLCISNCMLIQDHFGCMILGTILGGLDLGLMQGVITTLVAKHTPQEVRGTAFAFYHAFIGIGVVTSVKLTTMMAHYYNMWKAGFYGQLVVSFILFAIIVLVPKRFFNGEAVSAESK